VTIFIADFGASFKYDLIKIISLSSSYCGDYEGLSSELQCHAVWTQPSILEQHIVTHMTTARQWLGKHSSKAMLSTIERHPLLSNEIRNTHS
jgi:hypothetical protein